MLAPDSVKKDTHLGMAGHYAAMAEFLRRGYNVAIPAVDIGDDIIVLEDMHSRLFRVQVKTGAVTTDELQRRWVGASSSRSRPGFWRRVGSSSGWTARARADARSRGRRP